MAADKTATFGVKVDAQSNAGEAANSVEALYKRIAASQDAIKNYSSSLRNLRGSSEEVKVAKDKLKAAINAERDSVSGNVLALGKLGTTLDAVKTKAAAAAKATSGVKEGFAAAGGPVANLNGKLESLTSLLTGSGGAMAAVTAGAAGLVAAIAAVAASVAGAAVSLAKFIFESGNLLRTQSLMREAATGTAENAKAFGHQIDALAAKVPQTRAELNELAVSLSRSVAGTRVTGQAAVDTFNAVAQASAAMGDSAGKAIEGIITRGKQFGRMGLGLTELQGTGIAFQDVAAQLSANLKISLKDAQNQLFMGRVTIDAGAKAIRDTIEKRFAGINARRMLDLEVIGKKFRDTLTSLTEDVNLAPVLEGFSKLTSLFDKGSVTGAALKDLVTNFGNALAGVFKGSLPFIEKFITQLVIETTRFEIMLLKTAVFLKQTFGIDLKKAFGDGETAIIAAQAAFAVFAGAVIATGAAIAVPIANLVLFIKTISDVVNALPALWDKIKAMDWTALGKSILDGIVKGLTSGISAVTGAVSSLADNLKERFKGALGIHSPSTVFEVYGKQTTEGYSRGVEASAPQAGAAVKAMAPTPSTIRIGGAATTPTRTGNTSATVTVNVSFPNVKDGAGAAKAMSGPEMRAQLTRFFEEMFISAGVPTSTPQSGVT